MKHDQRRPKNLAADDTSRICRTRFLIGLILIFVGFGGAGGCFFFVNAVLWMWRPRRLSGTQSQYQRKRKARAKNKKMHRKLKMRNVYMVKSVQEIREEMRTGKVETRWDTKRFQKLDPYNSQKPYCITCAKQYLTPLDYESHLRGKPHKKRLKRIKYEEDLDRNTAERLKRFTDSIGFTLKHPNGTITKYSPRVASPTALSALPSPALSLEAHRNSMENDGTDMFSV